MAIDSTSSLKFVTGNITSTHDFEVPYYPLLDGMGIDKFVSSGTFTVGGCDWSIRFYPDGSKEVNGDYVSLYLHFVRGTQGVNVEVTFSLLLDKIDQVKKTFTKTFKSVGSDWGFPKFIKKSSLRELLHLYGGRFTIRSVLSIEDKVLHTQDAGTAAVVVPQPKLHQDLTDMLKSGEGADVTFSVAGQLFPAHRCILAARSMVFRAELFGAMMEKDAQRIEIRDMEPAVFKALLHFVYADSLPDDADSNVAMQHLLVAADRYGLDRLRLLCEAKLCRDIDVQTVASTLALAERHRCTQLRGACIGFIASRDVLRAVMETDGFKHLITNCPTIMKEILDKVAAVWSNK